ncbi:hypothetical protein M3152_01520 [Sporosarcina luteola]|uniref:hypothetical protein n=1 Tax=Sporosarcina luteola TaxID=582850 RepID=UPI002041D375|nr:hypothetical protein [Sporosarcina luteola]MCM3636380.1 hypothetical protein [Sporosarcina luteola]
MNNYDKYAEEWSKLNKEGLSLRGIAKLYGVSHNSVSRILRKHQFTIKEWHTSKFQDISNQVFGLITALEPLDVTDNGEYYWSCYCACNPAKKIKILGTDLRRGRKTHCGCNFPRKFNIAGQQFGFLTAKKDSNIRRKGHVMWECVCICSKKVLASYGGLSSGRTQSCGCQRPSGKDHHRWTGGSSEVKLFLRNRLKLWKKQSLAKYNYRCVISGAKKHLEIHHLNKSFIEIFYEALSSCNLKEFSSVGEYSDEELNALVESFDLIHFENGYGVPITRKLHQAFHSIYGQNTCQQDFEEFATNFKRLMESPNLGHGEL